MLDPNLRFQRITALSVYKGNVNDPFIKVKLQFFVTVAKILCPFLEVFHSEITMLPLMAEYLQDILYTIMESFIKKSFMEKAKSVAKLAKIDVNEKENLLPTKNVDFGFPTMKIISDVQAKQKVSDRKVFEIKNDCPIFLQSLGIKLLERCPL